MRVRGEGVEVGYEEEAVISLLNLHEVPQRPEIVAKVQMSRGAYSAKYCFHLG